MTTTKQSQRRAENQELLKNPNIWACLQMLSKSEGTNGDYSKMVYGVVTSSPLYPSLVGKRNVKIPNLNRFPQILVKVNSAGLSSSAAGKYQILRKTYNGLSIALGLTDFSENTQNLMAVELIRQRGGIPFLLKGDIKGALDKIKGEWASIAGAGYGQGENSIATLTKYFNDALGYAKDNPQAAGVSVSVVLVSLLAVFF